MLDALLILKKYGYIDRVTETKYIGYYGGDYLFGLTDGRMVAVDLVLGKVVRVDGVSIYGI